MSSDFFYIVKWWLFLFGLGLLFLPLTTILFNKFFDKGYIFSKSLGLAIFTYLIFITGSLHILPFSRISLFAIVGMLLVINIFVLRKINIRFTKKELSIMFFQELLFFVALLFWAFIKSFQPDIHGLEKYMDFGFMNSILRSSYFPPTDMWFPPESINYYYFGHLATAFLIKLTNIPGFIAYNLMLATIFAFTVTSAFSIVSTLTNHVLKLKRASFLSGILAGIITALGGNLHTIYAFFVPYTPAENPVPFWQLKFLPGGLIGGDWSQGFPNSYWYPNATRFIPFTIHEFPAYSFVVSDLHGHVLDIPFVFLTIALILSLFLIKKVSYKITVLISLMLAIMYMTNAWDGIIYFGLFIMAILLLKSEILKINKKSSKIKWFDFLSRVANKKIFIKEFLKLSLFTGLLYVLFTLPFNLTFKPFVSGIGILCAPDFLTKIGAIGPFLFETNHCQRTPFWMLIILYGFFYIFAISFVVKILNLKKPSTGIIFTLLLILLSTLLIAVPEFIYAKDIYPAHYRANTMFKLGYQAFIMLSLVASFSITYLFHKGKRVIWLPISFVLLTLILMYPYFAVTSYFNNLKDYKGLDGIAYLKTLHPDDYEAILWIQENIAGQPVILESQGDSYTDYGRISANTGLPTPLGWTVHEWLWRGDYSFPQSRLEDIRMLYEENNVKTLELIKKYNISYVYLGELERDKYSNINEGKFSNLGKIIYSKNSVKIYRIK
ncbi:MAG: DUF2298 domain-containing protein [Candidatus Levybacteria bacterium]|nr:DUF2298 domain-containing protein [Candidatus Levybacteria bacterium]